MGANLADLVQDAAATRPDVSAVVSAGRTTSWAELDRLVHAVSGGLTARRLDRGDRVAIVIGNSLEFVTSYFGILRAGLVAVPMNTSYTPAEIDAVLRSSGAKLVIADRGTAQAVRAAAGKEVPVVEVGSDEWRRLTVGSTPPPSEQTDPESLAVLIYTAGTSGKAKGAMLTHRALLANLDQLSAVTDPPPMLPADVVLIVLPMFHIYALNAALGMLAKTGATAIIADRFEPYATLDLIRANKVTNIAGAPPMYVAWSAVPDIGQQLGGVRMMASGAAPLPPAVFQQFSTAGLTIWEGYGMTEASPVICSTVVGGKSKPGSVGHSLPGIYLRLMDDSGQAVAEGDPGEIVIQGANLFSGYWPDSSDGPDAEGWFATGDVAIADFDGDLRLVDRRTDLILVSGFNVYPAEVEGVIAMAPGVREVAVLGVAHPYTGEAVKALVVAKPGITVTPEDIVEFAQTRLARFKTPTIVELVDELPRSVTGKVMKGWLRAQPGHETSAADLIAEAEAQAEDTESAAAEESG